LAGVRRSFAFRYSPFAIRQNAARSSIIGYQLSAVSYRLADDL
jgi:hypothetical protein